MFVTENIAGIKIKGAFFDQECELLPFALAAVKTPDKIIYNLETAWEF